MSVSFRFRLYSFKYRSLSPRESLARLVRPMRPTGTVAVSLPWLQLGPVTFSEVQLAPEFEQASAEDLRRFQPRRTVPSVGGKSGVRVQQVGDVELAL